MHIIDAQQGTEAWLNERNKPNTFNGSEAPAVMGESPYMTRTDLLKQKKSGNTEEVSPHLQRLFNKGHEAEEKARFFADEIVGQEFYPTVGYIEIDDMRLLASFDGITLDDSILFEHKLWNESLASSVIEGIVPDSHKWQLEQQLLVSGAERVLFMVSDGTKDNLVWCYYEPQEGNAEKLIAAWKQFKSDLETFVIEPEVIEAKAEPVLALPALAIRVDGAISIQSNLEKFGQRLKQFIDDTNCEPTDDQSFANLDQACKVLKEAEDALRQAEKNALAQTASVDEMRRTVEFLAEMARSNRLQFEKIVKTEKINRKNAIVHVAKDTFQRHCGDLIGPIPVRVNFPNPDFAGAVKGKKTLASMNDAVNTMLANAKIEADSIANDIKSKYDWYVSYTTNHRFLFNDIQSIIEKPIDDFKLLVESRIKEHEEQERIKEEARLKAQAEREERIRKEAEEKAQREAEQREAQIRKEAEAKAAQAEREKIEKERKAELARQEQDKREAIITQEVQEVEEEQVRLKDETEETITITRKEYDQLINDSWLLQALRDNGVDNWEGWEDSVDLFGQIKGEFA